MVKKYSAVFLFGMLGGLCRLLISHNVVLANGFPVSTIIVNLTGCLLFPITTYLIAFIVPLPSSIITGLTAGFVASLTTFSSLNMDCFNLVTQHQYILLTCYLALNIIGGILLSLLGLKISRLVSNRRGHF